MYIYVIVTIISNEQVHNHSHAHCFMRILEGTALETRFFNIIIMITIVRYNWPKELGYDSPLSEKSKAEHAEGTTAYMRY